MKLDADPTVIYPITKGKPLGRRILKSELEAVTGYNTYREAGLPEGPITNPGRASLAAVLNPALSSFNNGVRGYYFALAGTAWLLGPWAMIAAVAGAVLLLFWRQSGSSSARGVRRLRGLVESIEPVTDDAEEKGP